MRLTNEPADRVELEKALARELLATFIHTGNKVMTKQRIDWIEGKYGCNSSKRVVEYMKQMQNGEIL